MTLVKTGPNGSVEVVEDGPVHRAKLFDFDIDGTSLKTRHEEHLRTRVLMLLRGDPNKIARFTGKASRTGNEQHNFDLSNQRAETTMAFLAREGISTKRLHRYGVGSSESLVAGEDARSRCVDVDVWQDRTAPGPTPPAPRPSRDAPPSITLKDTAVFRVFGLKDSEQSFRQSDIEFTIDLPKATSRMKIEVRSVFQRAPLRSVTMTSGPMLTAGTHTWHWDGYDDNGVLRSRFLTNWLYILVHTDHGTGNLMFTGTPAPGAPNFASVEVNLATRSVTAEVAIDVRPSPGILPWESRVSAAQVQRAERLIVDGIHMYWSRSRAMPIPHDITVDGAGYNVTTTAILRRAGTVDDMKPVEYLVRESHSYWSRSCNFGVVIDGMPIGFVLAADDRFMRETGAHEFGHSVIKDYNPEASLKHKGTSDALQRVTGPAAPPPPEEIDLMKYYSDGFNGSQFFLRAIATEFDVKALIATVRLKFSSP